MLSSKFCLKLSKPAYDLIKIYVLSCDFPLIVSALSTSIEYFVSEPNLQGSCSDELLTLPGYSFSGISLTFSFFKPKRRIEY